MGDVALLGIICFAFLLQNKDRLAAEKVRKVKVHFSLWLPLHFALVTILGLQPRDRAAMLVVKKKEFFLLNLHQNRFHFPAERNAFVLDHQHGRSDVTCKPAICQI